MAGWSTCRNRRGKTLYRPVTSAPCRRNTVWLLPPPIGIVCRAWVTTIIRGSSPERSFSSLRNKLYAMRGPSWRAERSRNEPGSVMAEAIFWISAALIFYAYFGYPLLVLLWPRAKPIVSKTYRPSISIGLAAPDEHG